MVSAYFFLLSVFAFFGTTLAQWSTCYLPNGTSYSDEALAPCSADPSNPIAATCCRTKWDNDPGGLVNDTNGPTKDICLSNGLCQNIGHTDTVPQWTHYYRTFCSNKDWSDCLSVCDTGLNAMDQVQLTPCDDTPTSEKWCCGDTKQCCESKYAHQAVVIAQTLGSSTSSSTLPAGGTSTSAPGSREASKDKDSALKIGLGVGLGVGGAILIVGGVWLWLHYRKKKTTTIQLPDEAASYEEGGEIKKAPTASMVEMHVTSPMSELSGRSEQEMEGCTRFT